MMSFQNDLDKPRQITKDSPKDIVEVVEFVKRIYPRKGKIKDGDWQVVKVKSVEKSDTFVVVGNMVAMTDEYDTRYKIGGKLSYSDRTEEWQYSIYYSQELYEFKTKEDTEVFLSFFLTDAQLSNFLTVFPNPIEVLERGDINELMQIKKVGVKTAENILTRYNACKDKGKAYVELGKYGLSQNIIDRLINRYNSPEIAIEKINSNPYILVNEVRGVGFKKADEIALKTGIDPNSVERGVAFITYYFRVCAEEGDSYIDFDELLDAVDEYLGDYSDDSLDEAMLTLKNKGDLWYKDYDDCTLIAHSYYFNIEKEICNHIKRLMSYPSNVRLNREQAMERIKAKEEAQGWSYTERQLEGIFATMENNVTIITGYGGCVDCDTEYFNGKEWKRIADYKDGEQVLQYNEDGSANLVYPSKYVKLPENTLYHFATKYGTDQCLSLGHRVVYRTSKGNLRIKPFENVLEDHNNCKSGFTGKFYTTFNYNGNGIDMTEDEIRLQVAIIADGHFSGNTTWCKMRLKKERKQRRLEMLLNNLHIDYKSHYEDTTGFMVYGFYAPTNEKEFGQRWYDCSQKQFAVICDEVMYWDGSTSSKNSFYSTSKQTIDFVQFAFATIGKRCNIQTDDRKGQIITGKEKQGYTHKSVGYFFNPTDRNMVGIGGFHEGQEKTPIEPYKTLDGFQYCFAVPSTMLVLRRNGKIFITGNTGKTSAVTGMLACTDEGYDFKQCALSGKASANLTDVTGVEGSTIHSLLRYDSVTGDFMVNEHNQLDTDLVILDEGSMVDMELALALLKAIPNGAKLIILGDTNQLESIGAGNLLMDLIDSEVVPTIVFDKVHRQGAKSAIKTESIKVAEGKQLTKTTWTGESLLGELKDLKYIGFNSSKGQARPTIDLVMTEFKKLYKEAKDIKDIAVILPTKASGSSCHTVNLLIQDYVLPRNKGKGIELGDEQHPFTVYVGDKVINLRNNKKAYNYENVDGSYKVEKVIKPIFNGNMGEVIDIINDETILVDFYNIGEVIVDAKQIQHIALGYAITIHKAQGSTIPYVVGAVDYTHYSMLNRQLVYTLMSRAKTKLSFIFESKALSKAISTNYVTKKRTFLYHLLVGELE